MASERHTQEPGRTRSRTDDAGRRHSSWTRPGGCPRHTLGSGTRAKRRGQSLTSLGRSPRNQNPAARSRKEVFQPHLPVRLPCYDLAPVTCLTLGRPSRSRTSGTPSSHGLTGGVYKARERIHRAMADARLLANPASWGRVADPNPN